jgi:ribonuclease VapC
MVIDTSALLAILQGEPEASLFVRLIDEAQTRLVSAVAVLEAGIVTAVRKGPDGARALDALLHTADVDVVAFDHEQAMLARDAHSSFGRGRHPAALNFGDCASYALARATGEPLLFKGDDFAQTDIDPVDVT